jgi:hypothetical protein
MHGPLAAVTALVLAVAGNLYLASRYYGALRAPVGREGFIYGASIAMFVVEFLSLHAAGFMGGARGTMAKELPSLRSRIGLLVFYGAFAAGVGVALGAWVVVLYFLIDLAAKMLGAKAAPNRERFIVAFLVFMVTIFTVIGIPVRMWSEMFPMPPEVLNARPRNASGMFIDYPQTALVWGCAYFVVAAALEVLFFVLARGGTTAAGGRSRINPRPRRASRKAPPKIEA